MARKKPLPRSQRKIVNRGLEHKRTDDVKNVSVSLMDMDSAIMFYFTEVIKPTVIDNGENVKVPTLYASPERWFAIQKSGAVRDAKRQIILPAIVFRRTGMEKDETIPVDKMDPEDPKLHYTFQKKYTQENRYDRFAVQNGMKPAVETVTTGMPDFVNCTYQIVMMTNYIEQMNYLTELFIEYENTYFGDQHSYKFLSQLEGSFSDATEMTVEGERLIRTDFGMLLKGYVIPQFTNTPVTNKTSEIKITFLRSL